MEAVICPKEQILEMANSNQEQYSNGFSNLGFRVTEPERHVKRNR